MNKNSFAPLVEFNQLKQDIKKRNDILVVGTDISKRNHVSSFELSSGEILRKRFSFSNDIEGYTAFVEKINYYKDKYNIQQVICGLESTATYWKPLAIHLQHLGFYVVLVSVLAVNKNRQTIDVSKDKNDAKDAHNICDLITQGKFQYLNIRKGHIAELSRLFRIRFGLIKERAKIRIKLRQILSECFPELEAHFQDMLGATVLALLSICPFPKDVLELGEEKLTRLIKTASRHRLGNKKALTIITLAQRSIGIDISEKSTRLEFNMQLNKLKLLLSEIKTTEQMILDVIKDDKNYQLLLSIKGIGLVTAAGLIGEIGDINWYSSAKQLTKLAGLDLWGKVSGESVRYAKHITKKGRKYLRTIAYEAAVNCVRCSDVFKQKFNTLLENQHRKNKIKAIAYVAIADKILRIVFRMLKDGTEYDPTYDNKLKERYRPKQAMA
jgi:transposase